ncbi:hypothetical protein CRYUN_Cryun40dG0001700 [Craigia yunnanensis]
MEQVCFWLDLLFLVHGDVLLGFLCQLHLVPSLFLMLNTGGVMQVFSEIDVGSRIFSTLLQPEDLYISLIKKGLLFVPQEHGEVANKKMKKKSHRKGV